MLYRNFRISCILIFCVYFLLSACQDREAIEDVGPTNISVNDEYVRTGVFTYNTSNTILEGEYIVTLNEDLEVFEEKNLHLGKGVPEKRPLISDTHSKTLALGSTNELETLGKSLLKKHNFEEKLLQKSFDGASSGFFMKLTESQAKALSKDPAIKLIEQNKYLALGVGALLKTPFIPSDIDTDTEHLPYGVDRVGGSVNFETSRSRSAKWAWIVDTGIDSDHRDLNVDMSYSHDFTNERNFDDEHGHGTHVAGIIGARMDASGISGVAAGVKLVAIKVLKKNGSGNTKDLLMGLNYIHHYALPGDVVNISLGGSKSKSIEYAILNLAAKGVYVTVAAGNDGKDVKNLSPASLNGQRIYTVGAIDWKDTYTSYSNYGSSLDCAAPGDGILSTYIDGKYAYLSGTSMAAPHMAGVLLVGQEQHIIDGYVGSPDGQLPILVHK